MSGFRVGRMLGIELRVHPSWFIIVALVIWILGGVALPADFPQLGTPVRLAMALTLTVLFFASLLAHELAHSAVAVARGIPVHRITFFLFGGMAQTSRESRTPAEEFLIAVAGPIMSFLLAGASFGLWRASVVNDWGQVVAGSAAYVAAFNMILGVFNLLPGFPMDGGRILRSILWAMTGNMTRATRWASRVGVGMALLLAGYGVWRVIQGEVVGGLWLVLIALFIRNAARMSYRQHLMGRLQHVVQQQWEAGYHHRTAGSGEGLRGTERTAVTRKDAEARRPRHV
jgi:Zn-dependent protease